MKKLIPILMFAIVAFVGCKKDEDGALAVNGTFTAKFSYLDATTNKWSTAETFTAVTTVTTKTGNDYVIVATDASANVFTLTVTGVTGTGKYTTTRGVFKKGTKTYTSIGAGVQVTVEQLGATSLTASFITEGTDWSMYDGKVTANF